jgi:hypothetical protein
LATLKIGDIIYFPSEEGRPNGYIIEIDNEQERSHKVRWFDGWRDTWHFAEHLKKVKPLDQSKNR